MLRYGINNPGIESRWRRDFPPPSSPALGPTQPHVKWVPTLFPGGKETGKWRWSPTPSSVEVQETVQLYLLFPSESSWPPLGQLILKEILITSLREQKTSNSTAWVLGMGLPTFRLRYSVLQNFNKVAASFITNTVSAGILKLPNMKPKRQPLSRKLAPSCQTPRTTTWPGCWFEYESPASYYKMLL